MSEPSQKGIQRAAVKVTRWIGSVQSLVVHTIFFVVSFGSVWAGLLTFDRMLLVLTTVVSLEAIYLSIFIQISINSANAAISEVEHDIDEIQEDVEGIEKDVDEIQEDVEEIEKDVDELQEDVEVISEGDKQEEKHEKEERKKLEEIQKDLHKLMRDIESLGTRETS